VVVNKQSFYESIDRNTVFDEAFFKKVLGYGMYDKPFLEIVAAKLIEIGMPDMVEAYNEWYAAWKAEDDQQMKKVTEWYHKECDRVFEKRQKEQHRKAVEKWKENLQNMSNEELIRML
jgi:hypothetical protein